MNPLSEERRQAELDALGLDSFERTAFDDLVKLAADTFEVPIATISIVDRDRQWFISPVGIDVAETPREVAFCDYTIRSPDELLVVEDATQDERFASNPLVTGEPRIRFYAAAPLKISSGYAIGTLCVLDTHPRKVDRQKLERLRFMASQIVASLEARKKVREEG